MPVITPPKLHWKWQRQEQASCAIFSTCHILWESVNILFFIKDSFMYSRVESKSEVKANWLCWVTLGLGWERKYETGHPVYSSYWCWPVYQNGVIRLCFAFLVLFVVLRRYTAAIWAAGRFCQNVQQRDSETTQLGVTHFAVSHVGKRKWRPKDVCCYIFLLFLSPFNQSVDSSSTGKSVRRRDLRPVSPRPCPAAHASQTRFPECLPHSRR